MPARGLGSVQPPSCVTSCWLLSFSWSGPHRDLHSFPTRRSSDLRRAGREVPRGLALAADSDIPVARGLGSSAAATDRKSTRLNSSHTVISYAVFCLKKKNMRAKLREAPAAGVTTAVSTIL